ncbi:MAG: NAD-dependent epimerase/dehydratase family protein [Frondihabitans sp.]|nr:NAD-dependent epimerase/dehydratase family protein [Frondihabitans sp.]
MTFTSPLSVLFIGGTGTISASSVRRAVADGMHVTVLNRGINTNSRDLPDSVTWITADARDPDSIRSAVEEVSFDVVVNFLSFDAADAQAAIDIFREKTKQYIHISSASIYGKPVLQVPITESTPIHNKFVAYSREKIAAEKILQAAYTDAGFPMTIVRPSHTYDDANPPLPGGWNIVDRIIRGAEIPVHGDGTSLWTLTHADDLAQGLVGLIGNPRSIGEVFHITSDDVYTWDQIYTIVADALGTNANLVHIPSEMFTIAAPEWGWSELFRGDLGHSALFDNTKIRRFVPGYAPRLTFHQAILRMLEWRRTHLDTAVSDASTEAILDRMTEGYHRSKAAFESLTPALAN